MFERYTENARRVIFFARYEASLFGSPTIEPEHLLLGICRENGPLLAKLTHLPKAAVSLRNSLEQHLPRDQKVATSVELPLAYGTKNVLAKAHDESDALGHRHIGSEHLLLGLLADTESPSAKALQSIGITAEGIRNFSAVDPREKTATLLGELRKAIFECLDETFVEVHGIYLDKGCSLLQTLAGVSAEEASGSVAPGSATLAAQVEHVRFYLDVLNDVMRTKENVKVDWKEIWRTVRQVTPEEWDEQKRRLGESYDRVMTTLKSFDTWDGEDEIAGALSVLAHTAYHLGGIRQALGAIRAVKTG